MGATTIKLEEDLVKKVSALKTPEESISRFVRDLIEKKHSEVELRKAAQAYEAFLQNNPSEREAMEVWENAPLSDVIEPGKP